MNNIENIRKALGISRSGLASRVGVDRTMMWRYEKNICTPSDRVKVRIARELEKTVEEIFFGQPVAFDATKGEGPAGTGDNSPPSLMPEAAESRRLP